MNHRCVAAAVWMARHNSYAPHRVSAEELMEVRLFERALLLADRHPEWSPEVIATELSKEGHHR